MEVHGLLAVNWTDFMHCNIPVSGRCHEDGRSCFEEVVRLNMLDLHE